MEDSTLDSKLNEEINLTSYSIEYLVSSAKWGRFLAIIGFIGIGLMVIAAFTVGAIFGSMGSGLGGNQLAGAVPGFLFTIIYLVFAAVYFFPVLFLFKFSSKALRAVEQHNQHDIDESFHNLKRMFQFMGILTIIMLSLYAIGLLISLVGGAML